MPFEDLLVIILISPGLSFPRDFYVRAEDHSNLKRYQAELEKL